MDKLEAFFLVVIYIGSAKASVRDENMIVLSEPFSCAGRCFREVNTSLTCQCTTACFASDDCCKDFLSICQPMCAEKCQTYLPDKIKCQTCAFTNGSCVTNDEIFEFSKTLWKLNTFSAKSSDFVINKQNFTKSYRTEDVSREKLFTYVNESILQLESFQKLVVLFDNYEKQQGIREIFKNNKRKEQNDFINFVLRTPVGKSLWQFLSKRGLAGCGKLKDFKLILRKIWFENYPVNGIFESSGFEHVFVGQYHGGKTTGLHNWVRLYLLEKEGTLDYMGHLDRYKDNFPPGKLRIQFSWEDYIKPISTVIVGISPEMEFSVFTLCFLARPDNRCRILMEDLHGKSYEAEIQSYTLKYFILPNGLRLISTSYVL